MSITYNYYTGATYLTPSISNVLTGATPSVGNYINGYYPIYCPDAGSQFNVNIAGYLPQNLIVEPTNAKSSEIASINYILSNVFGSGAVFKTFISTVDNSPSEGVYVACFKDAALTIQEGSTQISDSQGKTYWFLTSGSTYYFKQQKDNVIFDVSIEVI